MPAGRDDKSSEEEDDDDEACAPLPPLPSTMRQRTSVSAEAFGVWNQRVAFVAPVNPKMPEQLEEIKKVMMRSFLFNSLDAKDMQVVALAMKGPIYFEPGRKIIQEGDAGEHLYIVTGGSLDCTKVLGGVDTVVKTCVRGDLFGELALLYNCPRAASVISREESIVYELDRLTFNNIVLEAVQKKRAMCIGVLQSVPLFVGLPQNHLETICDALKQEAFPQGTTIIEQGDIGKHFYIVQDGQVLATKTPDGGGAPVSMVHQAGDYFGELALMRNQPRAATVVAQSPEVKLLSMDASTFKRLMGPADEYLQRGTLRYA